MPENTDAPERPISFAKRVANAIWPTCHEVTRLTSQGRDRELSRGTRIRLGIHRFFCKWCARYAQQLDFLHEASQELPDHLDQTEGEKLKPDSKSRLKTALREQAKREQ